MNVFEWSVVFGVTQHTQVPKAAGILDLCSLTCAFKDLRELLHGFLLLDKTFKMCKIVNKLLVDCFPRDNVKCLYGYILVQSAENRLVKMICEVKLILKPVHTSDSQRLWLREHFQSILGREEVALVQKGIYDQLVDARKELVQSQKEAKKSKS